MLRSSATILVIAATLALVSNANGEIFVATLTNDQEAHAVNPTTSTGAPRPASFGTAIFNLNEAETAMTMDVTVSNIDFTGSQTSDTYDNLTAAHIHSGLNTPPATNSVAWGFFGSPFNDVPNEILVTPFASGVGGTITGKWDAAEGQNTTLTAQLENIRAGRAYINFHTVQYGAGEARGALVPEPTAMGLVALAGVALTRLRRRAA
jgi:hypothetical protein